MVFINLKISSVSCISLFPWPSCLDSFTPLKGAHAISSSMVVDFDLGVRAFRGGGGGLG